MHTTDTAVTLPKSRVAEYIKIVLWQSDKTTEELIAEGIWSAAAIRRTLAALEKLGRIFFKYDTGAWAYIDGELIVQAPAQVSADRGAPWA